MTLGEIADRLQATLEGDPAASVSGVSSLADAGAGEVSFLSGPRYEAEVARTRAGAVIVDRHWRGQCPCALLRVANPDLAFGRLAGWLGKAEPMPAPGVHPTAVLGDGVRLGQAVSIGACCVIEANVRIGDGSVVQPGCWIGEAAAVGAACRLYPRVTLRERVTLGDRVRVHSGAVIGSDGFGYAQVDGRWEKIPQLGTVAIGDDVEIGANTTIDRARFGVTRIGNGVKIDNLVQIAHNVTLGEHTAVAALVGIAGSASIGHHVQLGGQSGVAGHVQVGDNSVVAAKGGVTKSIPPGSVVFGFPAVERNKARRSHAAMMRLPEMRQRLRELERRLERLERHGTENGLEGRGGNCE